MSINLAAICVRGGSKGLPRKNERDFLGQSLVERAIEFAKELPQIDRIICSTDSEAIAELAIKSGADVPELRPDNLSSADSAKPDVWKYIIENATSWFNDEVKFFCDFDATNPIKSIEHFSMLYQTMARYPEYDGALLVKEARKNPYFNLLEKESGKLKVSKRQHSGSDVVARQGAPIVYEHIASMYVMRPEYLLSSNSLFSGNLFGYEVPEQFSFDIDSEFDWGILEYLYRRYVTECENDEDIDFRR